MTYLQNSSCDRDPESMLCTAPLKSMAATTIAAGFVAMTMLMPIKETMKLKFFIPEEGIDQNIEWTEEQLDSIKSTNIDIFNLIEAKRKLEYCKWTKQELKWLLNQDKNIFFNMMLNRVYTASDCLDNN